MNPIFSFLDWLNQKNATPSMGQSVPLDPSYQPTTWASGSPAGDDGGIMGGGDSLASGVNLSKDQISGGMMAAKGLGSAVNALTGGDQKPLPIPNLQDNSGAIRQQAGQMWQELMQRKPRGLI